MAEKTTVEIEDMRRLKQYALDCGKSLKQVINEALDEKIQRDRPDMEKKDPPPKMKSPAADGGMSLDPIRAKMVHWGVHSMFVSQMRSRGLDSSSFSPEDIDDKFLDEFLENMCLVLERETAETILVEIKKFLEGYE